MLPGHQRQSLIALLLTRYALSVAGWEPAQRLELSQVWRQRLKHRPLNISLFRFGLADKLEQTRAGLRLWRPRLEYGLLPLLE